MNFWDEWGKWVWRSAAGLAPVAIVLVIWLCFWSGFSLTPFAYDAVSDLAVLLPLDVY